MPKSITTNQCTQTHFQIFKWTMPNAEQCRMHVYKSFVCANFNYCPVVWMFCGKTKLRKTRKTSRKSTFDNILFLLITVSVLWFRFLLPLSGVCMFVCVWACLCWMTVDVVLLLHVIYSRTIAPVANVFCWMYPTLNIFILSYLILSYLINVPPCNAQLPSLMSRDVIIYHTIAIPDCIKESIRWTIHWVHYRASRLDPPRNTMLYFYLNNYL